MSTEQIAKFQPNRTLYLRGFDGAGAAAALYHTSAAGFSLSGVFRDMDDFCVLVIYDADNIFEHYSLRYLPDFNLSGLVLTFDVAYQGLQCLDSAKFSWIDWANLDAITASGDASIQPVLWDYATYKSGNYGIAQGLFTISTGPKGCTIYDRLTLFVNNAQFDFVSPNGGETADQVAAWFANSINWYNWAAFTSSSVAVIATALPGGQLLIQYARTGYVLVNGVNVTWTQAANQPKGIKFPGLASGAPIYIAAKPYTVDSVTSPTTLTLSTPAPTQTAPVPYLAPYGGDDGNGLTVYMVVRPANETLSIDKSVLPLTGGNSDNVTWTISLDFSALQLDSVRQAWFTFAPKLPAGGAYSTTEFTAAFSNWSLSDPNNIATLQIAGPNSVRVGNADSSCVYSPNAWSAQSANNYWRGFSQATETIGAFVTVTYHCSATHDLYLGTSFFNNRGFVGISVDNDTATTLDCYLDNASHTLAELVTRRLLRSSLPPGQHTVVITLAGTNSPLGQSFIFDYLEAAVPTPDIPDAAIVYPNVSPALDYDTDATYKMSPQRILWHLSKLGFQGHMNEYLGVFWWNQRVSFGAVYNSVVVTIGDGWVANEFIQIVFGTGPFPFGIYKSIISTDTVATIASHFVYYINSSTVSVWAEITPPTLANTACFTIHIRTPDWSEAISIGSATSPGQGTITLSSNAGAFGVPGIWKVDPTASNPLNFAIRQWHTDLFSEVQAAGNLITTSFSMELVYPPDYGQAPTVANAWQARFADGTAVQTDTGFAGLISSQCVFVENMTNFQTQVYLAMAELQSAAGLTPWLQFGEFLWWFFPSKAFILQTVAGSNPVSLQLATSNKSGIVPHGMATGDRIVITGVNGCTSLNGTWTVTVLDPQTFTIPATANAAWTPATGTVRGGSMAYYDPATTQAAQQQLGRPLFPFTCQDDDPAINQGADAAFLAQRLKAHTGAISTAVLAQYPNAKFEVLYPNDVNNPVCLVGPGVTYSQGGRLNAAVNLPSQWYAQPTSGLDSFKVEALSWSATYQNMDLARQAVVFALTPPMSWDISQVAYLVPWFNGTCPWPREFLAAASRQLNIVNFWAYDHLSLMSWPVPLPFSQERSNYQG